MQLKSLKEILAAGKEGFKQMMLPMRERMIKAKADLEMATLETKIMEKEGEIQDFIAGFIDEKTINFPRLMMMLDDLEILQGRKAQYDAVLAQLFPVVAVSTLGTALA